MKLNFSFRKWIQLNSYWLNMTFQNKNIWYNSAYNFLKILCVCVCVCDQYRFFVSSTDRSFELWTPCNAKKLVSLVIVTRHLEDIGISFYPIIICTVRFFQRPHYVHKVKLFNSNALQSKATYLDYESAIKRTWKFKPVSYIY